MIVAIDTNVLMDLAAEVESVVDAMELVRRRIPNPRLIVVRLGLPIADHGAQRLGCFHSSDHVTT